MKIPFNRDLITDQMNALGLSERGVIRQTGIPNFTFRQARQTGELEGTLTLRQLRLLADTLGVTMPQLLTDPDDHAEAKPPDTSAQDDASRLIPLLVDLPKMVSIDHIARSTGWHRTRLQAALDAIPAALHGTGLRLHTSNGSIKIVPTRRTDNDLKRALGRARTLSVGLNTTEAVILTRIINGDNVLERQPSNNTRVATGSLKNMGCIALDDAAVFEPTDELRLALPDLDSTR